jgi:dihydrofolate reductase
MLLGLSTPSIDGAVRIIVAMSSNGIIGRLGGLPWNIPQDRAWFEHHIRGGVVVMGRKCFEETGAVLPGAHGTVVLSRRRNVFPGAVAAHDLPDGLRKASALARTGGSGRVWVCGGEAIYEEALPLASYLYLTHIHASVEGDTKFPTKYKSYFPHPIWTQEGADPVYRLTFAILAAKQ